MAPYGLCGWSAMPLDESDSHVKVNWVLVGVVACWSSMLTAFDPGGGEGNAEAAALAMAAEMIPWSELVYSPRLD